MERKVLGTWSSRSTRRSQGPSDTSSVPLPVFGFEEEAEMFVRFEAPEVGWSVMETTPGEVASVLCGLCAVVGKVALDPPPAVCGDGLIGLVSLGRKAFLEAFLVRKKAPLSRRVLRRGNKQPSVGLPA